MYTDHYQAEATGVMIGRRQGREAGYAEGWNAALAGCQERIDELNAALTAMFVIAYPALAAIQQSGDSDIQHAFVKHYAAAIQENATKLQHLPHEDPEVLRFGEALRSVINQWLSTVHGPNHSCSP
ncbi:hypothetical protein [Achromobacter dolens]|uniref:hypothetical protein n=1 Tax=Achromobacter dolens TaxID=1287738 RepID=UPI0035587958